MKKEEEENNKLEIKKIKEEKNKEEEKNFEKGLTELIKYNKILEIKN
jgi:hypothetical protein